MSLKTLAILGTVSFCICLRLPAQITTAEITGTVTDTADAVIAGATVTATNPATNTQRTATTSGAGVYSLSALPPGVYSLRVEMPGFSSQVRSNIELQVAQVARFDVTLQVGNVTEVVEVQGGAPLIETDNTSLGTVIENQRILDLPLNGRNYLQLAALTPGATTAAPASFVMGLRQGGTRSLFTLTVSGQRIIFNRYLLDGLENTSPNWQSYIFLPSLDALQEFKVESGITPAEYGKNATQINVTTKSGTNNLHGSAWEFVRNSYFDARNYFNPKSVEQPPFKRNQFGFTIGGPLYVPKVFNGRNKLFFMVNYEGLRERKALVQPATVPPSAWVNGDFSAVATPIYDVNTRVLNAAGNAVISSTPFPGNRIPASRLAPISVKYMQDWMPTVNAAVATANNFTNTEGRPTDNNQENARFDWVQNSNSTFF
ncbi:MAG: carboxypeptidase-like regulatory domain-containing protein, partial [Acidobacteriota bacterium]|nr:carboxypeptidase-like regulatory domain-containing protein [Acidobacteriota bacterium]